MTTITEFFDLAVRHYQGGNPQQAEALCRQILDADPAHAAAHHLLGLLAANTGRQEMAVALLRKAIALNPSNPDCRCNLGIVLMSQGQSAEGIACYRQALRLNPHHEQAQINLGNALKDQGQLAEAVACYRQVLLGNPANATALNNLAIALREQGQLGEAIACYRQSVGVNPMLADAHFNLGIALNEEGQLAEAIACYRQALRINPQHAAAHNNLGSALKDQGQFAEAIACYRQAVKSNPLFTDAQLNLGNALKDQGQFDEAILCYRQALRLNADHAEANNKLGTALFDQGHLAEAAECYRHVLRLYPHLSYVHNNLGVVLRDQGQLAEAELCFRQALSSNAGNVDAHINLAIILDWWGQRDDAMEQYEQALRIDLRHEVALWNRALLRLRKGDFEGGWPDYEHRWAQSGYVPSHQDRPRWDGSALEGKTILLHAEQGLGDTIQFIRYAPLVKQRGGTVQFECPPALERLCTGMAGIDHLSVASTELAPYDVQAPLLSLPGILGTTLATIPAAVPYLHADPGLVAHWKKELAPLGGFKVGIAWQGSLVHRGDRYRSFPLRHFESLAGLEGVRLVSLQKGPGTEQLQGRFPILDLSDGLDAAGAFLDTAAIMMNLDLVIAADSAVAHLAGALAVPVWVALSIAPDWRWLLNREDSPWYPTMRLFRQQRFGDWSEVFERIADELEKIT